MNLLEHYQQYPEYFMVNKHPEKDLYLVKYIHLGIDWSIEGALDARGLILDSSGNVVARPYKKFFNYKELEGREDLPEHIRQLSEWEENIPYEVQEKVDGSLIILFSYQGDLIFASSGSFNSEHSKAAEKLFYEQFSASTISRMKKGILRNEKFSLLFELVGPHYQIVVPYEKEQLILHDIIALDPTGMVQAQTVRTIAAALEIPMVKKYDLTQRELEEAQSELKDVEGFVIKFANGKMLKIKTEDYFTKAKDVAIFFGKFFTYRKIGIVVDAIFDDTYDDLVASATNHPKIKENIEAIYSLFKEFETELLEYKAKWDSGEFVDRKEIATNPETKPRMHMIFLSLKDREQWKSYFRTAAFTKFIKEN
jgi:T4 RnlA family RNA ligase